MNHSAQHIIILLLFLLTTFSALGQSVGEKQSVVREKYPDIDLYYRWQEKEAQDGAYRRAYEAWMTNGEKDVLKTTPVQNSLISKIDSLSHAFSEKFELTQDYEKAFYIGLLLEEKLSQAKEIQHPTVRRAYYKLGEAYYLFLDFHKSISLLENALSHVPSDFDDQTNFEALNIIGICYANIGEMETSDEYFRATLLSNDIVLNRPIYNAYALSHLACNAMMMKQYNKALALSEIAWSFLRKETEDYGHLAGMCYCRGRSFLETVDFQQASLWIDSLAYFAPQDQYNLVKRTKQSYQLRVDYYAALGDIHLAKQYNDSLVDIYRQQEELYILQYVARAVEQYKGEKLTTKLEQLQTSRLWIIAISVIALLSICVGVVITLLYRCTHAAYKILAKKAQEWANEEDEDPFLQQEQTPDTVKKEEDNTEEEGEKKEEEDAENDKVATADDNRIMLLVKKEMSTRYAYRETDLTAELLADRLGIHRNTLSHAINRATDYNFSQYVNSFRIKEAIRIMQKKNLDEIRIDEIYERVGFGSRTSFYRAFKQFTGLTPAEFLNND